VAATTKGLMSDEDIVGNSTNIVFKMFMQFKTWMPRLMNERFGTLRYVPTTESFQEGRYIVIGNELFGKNKHDAINGAAYVADREIGNFNRSIVKRLGFVLANVLFLHKLNSSLKFKTDEEHAKWMLNRFKAEHRGALEIENFSLDDFVRIRQGQINAAIAEIRVALLFMVALLMANADWDGDDEKDFKRFWATRKLIQTVNRAQSELAFFYNPSELRNWFKGMIPMFGLVEDMAKSLENFAEESYQIISGHDNPYDKTPFGYYGMDWLPGMNKMTAFFELFAQDKAAER